MNTPKRIQLSRRKGWRKPAGAVLVSRPSRWGNPFTAAEHGAAEAVRLYRAANSHPDAHQRIKAAFRGRDLACWCKVWVCDKCGAEYADEFERGTTQRCKSYYARGPANERRRCPGTIRLQPCHADVLLEIANS